MVPEWFGRLPELPRAADPDYEAPYTTVAYYRPGAAEADRIGAYFINTHAPETRPRFEAEVLAYHESVPGHHFQIALGQEVDVSAFRRHGGRTAYVEGYHTERLADQMGLYTGDPTGWGCCHSTHGVRPAGGRHRCAHQGLVTHSGEAFLLENTPLAENNIRNEVDRYITWPGQALAYKMGQLTFGNFGEAEAAGEAFDARFPRYDAEVGAVTLPVLRSRIEA